MTAIKRDYWSFYFMGRDEPLRALRNRMETAGHGVDDLVDAIDKLDAVDIPAVVREACEAFATKEFTPKARGKWIREYGDAIAAASLDRDMAFLAWRAGRVDELAVAVEAEVVERMLDHEDPDAGE